MTYGSCKSPFKHRTQRLNTHRDIICGYFCYTLLYKLNFKGSDIMENKGCNCGKCKDKLCTYKVPIFSCLDYEEMISLTNLIIHKKYEKKENIILVGIKLF